MNPLSERTPEQRDRDLDTLQATWSDPPGLVGWLATVDHKRIGRRYIVTALVFFVIAGILTMLTPIQLTESDNPLFSMHGSLMLLLFAVPVMEAVAVFVVPLMVGARNIAFPRLAAFSYWIYLFGGIMVLVAFLFDVGSGADWTGYAPSSDFSPGQRVDFWTQMIAFTEVAALCVAVELVATILAMRAPGMTLARIPLFVWSMLVASLMVIVAMPVVILSSIFLITDRLVGTQFYNAAQGGDPLLWQRLSGPFGHPETYIMFMPALGMISSIVETFSRRPIFGYTAMVLALVTTGFLSFGLWVLHMLGAGLSSPGMGVYIVAGTMIAILGGLQIGCWIATLSLGRRAIVVPLLFVLGLFAVLVIDGVIGAMSAFVPLGLPVQDTYFDVAHFPCVLIGVAAFPLMGALYFWFPKVTGHMLSESMGRLQFWLFFIGFNVAFFPIHLPNAIALPGSWLIAASVMVFAFNVFYAVRQGRPSGDNPWGASDLLWATSSPPPAYNFEAVPVVDRREPLWPLDARLSAMTGLSMTRRETLLTSSTDAVPATRWSMPVPDIWPLWSALALTALFVWSILSPWGVVWGSLLLTIALIVWSWPKAPQPGIEGAQ